MRRLFDELLRRDRVLTLTGAGMFAALAIGFVLAAVDTRVILGINPWIKPMKFAASIGIFLWTLAWLWPEADARFERRLRWIRRVIVMALIGEITLISLQSARGTTSHFNVATPIDGLIFQTMGLMIVANTIAVAVWLATLRRPVSREAMGYRSGIVLGTLIFILGSLQGFVMVARLGHAVPGPDGGAGLPFVNWSTTGGDLRIAHFLGLHALQALPLAGWWLDQRASLTPASRRSLIGAAGAAWLVVCVVALMQALAGTPAARLN